ncbi:MAB_1171c family putative transporter [Nocardia goodfellowii]|uniref:DUF6545 domain-containing protein n=1 Tax=Nocardia goodfellowii TaxID=882446 RepID=A0ABS4Q6W8_9NOCA|nr:MAB_1171c family putative transporter [Nocardia goodfellowii]MBP2187443.1 hypothetical protein [Nocardia goodfellowii]
MPTPGSVAIAAFLAVVLAGRWWLVNELNSDRLLNRAFSWNLVGMLVWGVTGWLGRGGLGEQLYLAVAVLGVANIYGLARLLHGADPARVWARQRKYDAVAAAASGATVLGILGLLGDRTALLLGMLWAASNIVLGGSAVLVARGSWREMRTRSRTPRERLAYAILFAVCVYSAAAAPVGVLAVLGLIEVSGVLGGARTGDVSNTWAHTAFLTLGVLTAVLAIPLVRALAARTGWDSTGRDCRRLHPLWSDLTAAVPEVVLAPDTQHPDPELRLYRMTVEIWDALMRLKPYASEHNGTGDAWHVAQALHAKVSGAPPAAAHPDTSGHPPTDHATELRHLFDLARAWPEARASLSTAAAAPQRRSRPWRRATRRPRRTGCAVPRTDQRGR